MIVQKLFFIQKAFNLSSKSLLALTKQVSTCFEDFMNLPYKRQILGSDQANSVKNAEINKQLHVKFWFNRKNMELSHIYLAVKN